MKDTITVFILQRAKAVIALVVATVVSYLAQQGVIVDDATQNAFIAGLGGLLTAVAVHYVPNKK
jgi:uncharacterized membrane protein (DUF441 family)